MSLSWPAGSPGYQGPGSLDGLETRLEACLSGRVRDFQVCCEGGGLVLRGRAQTYYARQMAVEALRHITNLPVIANHIVVS